MRKRCQLINVDVDVDVISKKSKLLDTLNFHVLFNLNR